MRCFYASLFDDHWIPSPVFCRLVDSLFIYANENCSIPAMKNTGKMEFSKILDVRGAVAGKAALAKLPVNNRSSATTPCAPLTSGISVHLLGITVSNNVG